VTPVPVQVPPASTGGYRVEVEGGGGRGEAKPLSGKAAVRTEDDRKKAQTLMRAMQYFSEKVR
jgi:hypothetical protein